MQQAIHRLQFSPCNCLLVLFYCKNRKDSLQKIRFLSKFCFSCYNKAKRGRKGRFAYKYVGATGGFGIELLKDAPKIVQVHQKTAKFSFIFTNFDAPRGTRNILKGFDAYEKSFSNMFINSLLKMKKINKGEEK